MDRNLQAEGQVRRWALFGSDTYYPSGGWDDLHGLYEWREDAETVSREQWRSYDHWQLVDLKAGEIVWEKASYDLDPCRGREHEWGEWNPIPNGTLSVMSDATKTRRCERCGREQQDGTYHGALIFPTLAPLTNSIRWVR